MRRRKTTTESPLAICLPLLSLWHSRHIQMDQYWIHAKTRVRPCLFQAIFEHSPNRDENLAGDSTEAKDPPIDCHSHDQYAPPCPHWRKSETPHYVLVLPYATARQRNPDEPQPTPSHRHVSRFSRQQIATSARCHFYSEPAPPSELLGTILVHRQQPQQLHEPKAHSRPRTSTNLRISVQVH